MIWISIFILAVAIIIVTIIQNSNQKKHYDNQLDTATENLRHCQNQFDLLAKDIYSSTIKQYGERFANNIVDEKICENMPSELLILSCGNPEDKKSQYYKGNKNESWFYDGFTNRLGNRKYRKEVFVENNKITGWRDLN